MKLYRTPDGHWWGTQIEAKKADRDYEQVEVPTDKPGLLTWLNENTVIMGHAEEPLMDTSHMYFGHDPLEQAEQRAIAAATPPPQRTAKVTLIDVEEFVQSCPPAPDLASVASNVCWRIKELANETQSRSAAAGE